MDALGLDQLLVLATVADTGSFARAARRLGRAQSAVTYAVGRLEAEVGAPLFDRSAYRPVLNATGQALLPRARRILSDVDAFRAQARGVAQGLEARLTIVISALAPMTLLAPGLADFHARFPHVPLRLSVAPMTGALMALSAGRADLGVVHALDPGLDGMDWALSLTAPLVAVAAPLHPLAGLPPPIPPSAMRDHLQLVLTDPDAEDSPDRGVIAVNTWRVADLAAKHALLLAGLGWGSMPRPMVDDDLRAGRLTQLTPERWDGGEGMPVLHFAVAHSAGQPLGPAGRWLFDRLRAEPPSAGGTAPADIDRTRDTLPRADVVRTFANPPV
jgi:DNA-binding transcriptional LysR family regulator